MSRIQILAVLLLSSTGVAAGEPARYVVHMLDPRVVATTEHTLPIEWRKQKTDIIATRALFKGEADHLLKLLKKELTTNTDVPFCGHHPGYAVQKLVDGKPTDSVTVCGLCHTWTRSGGKNQLRVLSGDRSLAYLQSLLPPPQVFKEVAKPSDLADPFRNHSKPFYLITEEDFPNDDG